MTPSRRTILAGAGLIALLGAPLALLTAPRLRDAILTRLEAVFGPEASSDEGLLFLEAFLDWIETGGDEDIRKRARAYDRPFAPLLDHSAERDVIPLLAINGFAHSTNIVRARETGEPFAYIGLFDPYETPCANQLNAAWL